MFGMSEYRNELKNMCNMYYILNKMKSLRMYGELN